jgi:hypothetical protein
MDDEQINAIIATVSDWRFKNDIVVSSDDIERIHEALTQLLSQRNDMVKSINTHFPQIGAGF